MTNVTVIGFSELTRSQIFAALRPASGNHPPASLGSHTCPEPMLTPALQYVGLISTFDAFQGSLHFLSGHLFYRDVLSNRVEHDIDELGGTEVSSGGSVGGVSGRHHDAQGGDGSGSVSGGDGGVSGRGRSRVEPERGSRGGGDGSVGGEGPHNSGAEGPTT